MLRIWQEIDLERARFSGEKRSTSYENKEHEEPGR